MKYNLCAHSPLIWEGIMLENIRVPEIGLLPWQILKIPKFSKNG
jgi:hypothetical protein